MASFNIFINNYYYSLFINVMKQFLFLCATVLVSVALNAQTNNDTTAIKQLLEEESATWRSGDMQAHADCWHIQPYSKILVQHRMENPLMFRRI